MGKDSLDDIVTSLLISSCLYCSCKIYTEFNIKYDMWKLGVKINDENNRQGGRDRHSAWLRGSLFVVIFILILGLIKIGAIPSVGFFGDGEDGRPPGGGF